MKFRTSTLFKIADEYAEELTEDDEIKKIDRTNLFWKELREMLKDKELINIQINGRVRKGKSTIAIKILTVIIQMIREELKLDVKIDIENIARDQQEFSKIMREPTINNTCVLIDEFSDMERTGENSTIEQALLDQFSKVQAGRYIHDILKITLNLLVLVLGIMIIKLISKCCIK